MLEISELKALTGLCLLRKEFPKAFPKKVKPLKIGISKDINELQERKISNRLVKAALRYYVNSPEYRKAILSGGARIDLNGREGDQVDAMAVTLVKEKPKKRFTFNHKIWSNKIKKTDQYLPLEEENKEKWKATYQQELSLERKRINKIKKEKKKKKEARKKKK